VRKSAALKSVYFLCKHYNTTGELYIICHTLAEYGKIIEKVLKNCTVFMINII